MEFTVLTLFPEMFSLLCTGGIFKRSVESGLVTIATIDIRDFSTDRHRTVDDRPYGGGCGMVMKAEPLAGAIRHAKLQGADAPVVLLSPQGPVLDQAVAEQLAGCDRIILVCGRYEGIDERVCRQMVDQELSIGNYVLSGGELAAMVVMDVVCRLIPGALGNDQSAREDSFASGLLKYPQYTRPRCFEHDDVPEILLSGDHGAIRHWRRRASILQTLLKRPELLDTAALDPQDIAFLEELQAKVQTTIDRHSEAP